MPLSLHSKRRKRPRHHPIAVMGASSCSSFEELLLLSRRVLRSTAKNDRPLPGHSSYTARAIYESCDLRLVLD
jgi:hypothetical protein